MTPPRFPASPSHPFGEGPERKTAGPVSAGPAFCEGSHEGRRKLMEIVTGFPAVLVFNAMGEVRGAVAGGFPMIGAGNRRKALSCAIRF